LWQEDIPCPRLGEQIFLVLWKKKSNFVADTIRKKQETGLCMWKVHERVGTQLSSKIQNIQSLKSYWCAASSGENAIQPAAALQQLLLETVANGSTKTGPDIARLMASTLLCQQIPPAEMVAATKAALAALTWVALSWLCLFPPPPRQLQQQPGYGTAVAEAAAWLVSHPTACLGTMVACNTCTAVLELARMDAQGGRASGGGQLGTRCPILNAK
jgi:hypothetical protein